MVTCYGFPIEETWLGRAAEGFPFGSFPLSHLVLGNLSHDHDKHGKHDMWEMQIEFLDVVRAKTKCPNGSRVR